ncbi:hypothetical protein GCM10010129_21300 [Streptomyces fumigatiscleroticus]|nr:hypothetical protein GCM10010129_21300 [Streptomyces fumigatiscleroticus]
MRGEHLAALVRQVASVQVHRGALDPGSADVHAEDLHGFTLRRGTDGHCSSVAEVAEAVEAVEVVKEVEVGEVGEVG